MKKSGYTFIPLLLMLTGAATAENIVVSSDSLNASGLEELTAYSGGISGVFQHKANRVRFETRRGKRTPAAIRQNDPGAPLFEIDIRFLDDTGYPFFVQFGGHGPIDESWMKSDTLFPDEFSVPNDAKARSNFLAAELTLERISRLRFKTIWGEEQMALTNVLPAIREAVAMDTLEPIEQVAAAATSCNFRHKLSVYKGNCCFNFISGGEHSATRATNVSPSGTVTQIWSTNNHGRSYSESGMSFYDSWTSPADRCSMNAISYPAQCTTNRNYSWTCGGHVCNDDSVIQCESLKTRSTPTGTSGTCSDCTLRLKAPRCD